MIRIRCILLVSTLMLAVACQDEQEADWRDNYSFVRQTEYVTVYGYDVDESDACGGSFEELDIHTRWVMDPFGVEDTSTFKYRWMSNAFWDELYPPPARMGALTWYGEPYTRWLPDLHEISHMVEYAALPWPGCAPVLQEGLATYLEGPALGESYPSGYSIFELMIPGKRISAGVYARAAHFVSFVIETYGTNGYVRLCTAVGWGSTLQEWDRGISQALGVSLDELLALYDEYPICHRQQLRARAWECAGEIDHVFTKQDHRFVVEGVGCEDRRAVNLGGKRRSAALRRLVYFPEETTVDLNANPGVLLISQECAPCSAQPQVFEETEFQRRLYSYRAGVHEIIAIFDKDQQVRFEMIGVYYK